MLDKTLSHLQALADEVGRLLGLTITLRQSTLTLEEPLVEIWVNGALVQVPRHQCVQSALQTVQNVWVVAREEFIV